MAKDCLYYSNMEGLENPELNDDNLIGNEEDLDGYLYDHRDELLIDLDGIDLTFSLAPEAKQWEVVRYIENQMEAAAESYAGSNKKYDITSAWDEINPDTFTFWGKSDSASSFPVPEDGADYAKMGDIVGRWIAIVINQGEDVLDSQKKDYSIYNNANKDKVEKFYNSLKQTAIELAKILKEKFKGAEFKFESRLMTKNLTHEFLSLLNALSKSQTGTLVEALFGRVDITAIMPDGSTATIELKTSGHDFPENFSPSAFTDGVIDKRVFQRYCAQVLSYNIIRRQHGFRDTPYLLHVKRFPDGRVAYGRLLKVPTDGVGSTFESIIRNGIPLRNEVKVEDLTRVNQIMARIFGKDASIANTLKELERDISYFLDPDRGFVKTVTDDMLDAKQRGDVYYFYNTILEENVYAKNEEELKLLLGQYLKDLNKRSKSALINISKEFNKIRTIDELENLLLNNGYGSKNVQSIIMKLAKYLSSEWSLVDNEAMIANGCLMFQGAGRTEIIMIEDVKSIKEMHKFPNMKNGTTILGMLYGDTEVESRSGDLLNAQYENLMIMKAMAFISENPELFTNHPISSISAMNIRRGEVSDNIMNSTIIKNWKLLSAKFRDLELKQIDHCFMGDGKENGDIMACVARARDLIKMCEDQTINGVKGAPRSIRATSNLSLFTMRPEAGVYTYAQLVEMWHGLERLAGGPYDVKMDPRFKRAFTELNKAILIAKGYHISTEPDVELYLNEGLSFSGGYMSPFARSKSANQRLVDRISGTFHYRMYKEIQELVTPFQNLLADVLAENKDYVTGVSSEYVVSENWFVRTPDGKIDKSFRIRPPWDPNYTEKERKLVEYVLETFAKLRWPGKSTEHYKKDPNSAYYELPLFESGWIETAATADELFNALKNLATRRGKRFVSRTKEMIQGQEYEMKDAQDADVLNQHTTSNPFWDEKRGEKLEQYGPDIFTKNIDNIFLYTVIAAIKFNLSTEFLPLFTSVRHLLQYEIEENGAQMEDLTEAINQYIGTVIFDVPGVKSNLRVYQHVIQMFRQFFSTLTLGLDIGNMVRDTFSSNLRTATVLLNGGSDVLGISSGDFFKAYEEMCQNSGSLFTSHGFYNQMNLIHRMANMSYREVKDQLKTNKFSIGNLDSGFIFMTSTSSDYIHRMALLKAYLQNFKVKQHKGDKVVEVTYNIEPAYTLDANGNLTYDMKKDPRWAILYKYKTHDKFSINDRSKVPADELKEYLDVWTLYTESIKEWQTVYSNIEVGDELPLGLDPRQQKSLKNLANKLYGAYDKDEQALVHQTLLGGAFFQFKTYGISRLMDWWKRATEINIIQSNQLRDENGKLLYERLNTAEEVAATGEFSTIITEDEVTNADILEGRVAPLKSTEGGVDEGRMQSTWAVMALAYKSQYGKTQEERDQANEALTARMKSPMFRKNLLAAMLDIFTSLIIQGLIRIVYPEEALDAMTEQDWWTRWSYAVMTGVAQDGPIWEVFNSVWGDGEIPVVGGMARWFNSVWGVLNGKDFAPALLNSFGATRELTSMLDNM